MPPIITVSKLSKTYDTGFQALLIALGIGTIAAAGALLHH